jgi:hypothetical protein
MSIQNSIENRIQEGRLHRLEPWPVQATKLRDMLLTNEFHLELTMPRPNIEETEQFAMLEADLATFVHHPSIDSEYIYLLSPPRDAVWEIRSVRPEPQIRVFAFFAAKDVLVATHFAWRADLSDSAWKEEKKRAKAIWDSLFPGFQPKGSTDIRTLVTGAVDGKYFHY